MRDPENQDKRETVWNAFDPGELRRILFEEAPDSMFLADREGGLMSVNSRMVELAGYSRKELLAMNISDLLRSDYLSRGTTPMEELASGRTVIREQWMLRKDAGLIPVEVSARMVSAGVLLSVVRDITERRRAEVALHLSQKRLSAILNNIPDIAWLKDTESRFIAVNDAFARAAGCASVDLVGKTDLDIWPRHLAESYRTDDVTVMRSRERRRVEERLVDSVGSQSWIDTIKTPILDEAGEVIGTTGIARDITERKLAEEALAQANLVVENSPVVLFLWGAAEGWPVAMVSRNVIQFGYTAQELLSGAVPFSSMVHPDDRDRVAREVREYSASGVERFQQRYRIVTKDGGVRWVDDRTVVERTPDGQIAFYQGIVLDITEPKLAEEKLAHSHDLMRYIIEHANSSVAVHDRDLRYIYVSQRYLDEYKVKERDVIGKHHYDIFSDLPQKWRDVHQRALAGEVCSADRDPYCRADGAMDWTRWECRPWYEADGMIGGIIVYTEVITDRVQAEEALRESEERYRVLFEGAAEGIAVADLDTKLILYANPAYCEMYGYSVEQLIELGVEDLHPSESLAGAVADFEAQARGEKSLATNVPCLRKDGSVFFADINTRPVVVAGRPVVVGFFTDITERKRAEEALLALSIRQQALLAAIPDIIMEVDHRRVYTWANQAGLDFFGADILGQEASAYFEGEQETYDTVEPVFQGTEDVIYVESWQRRRDGQKRLLAWWCRALKDEQGRVTGALSSARDITGAKQAEAALRESEERFSVFMSHLPASAFIKEADGRMVFANRYLQELFGIQDYAGKTTTEIIAGDLAVQMTEGDHRALAEGILSTQETFCDAQGRERTFEVLKFPIHTAGKPVRLGGVAMDITGLKQTEAALRASLEEKTALLQEVHHRVKNNLQIVSSLLELQVRQEKSLQVLSALRDTQNRVRSMAMLHEMLYRSKSLAQADFAAYLNGLCVHLFRASGLNPNQVRLECRATAVELGLDQAVPCGLIINELVSNALKHAFPEGRAGRVTVELRRDADDRLVLTVADDGVGLPAGLDFSRTSSLGLQLVRILAKQLEGALTVERAPNTTFHVSFPSV